MACEGLPPASAADEEAARPDIDHIRIYTSMAYVTHPHMQFRKAIRRWRGTYHETRTGATALMMLLIIVLWGWDSLRVDERGSNDVLRLELSWRVESAKGVIAVLSFVVYLGLIYLLLAHQREEGIWASFYVSLLFVVAMAVSLIASDDKDGMQGLFAMYVFVQVLLWMTHAFMKHVYPAMVKQGFNLWPKAGPELRVQYVEVHDPRRAGKWLLQEQVLEVDVTYSPDCQIIAFSLCHWWFVRWKTERFQFIGTVNEEGMPHGYGEWEDSDPQGERLQGVWTNGLPVAPFKAVLGRNLSSFTAYRIAYWQDRKDEPNKILCWPTFTPNCRVGAVSVECCVAGLFFKDYPRVNHIVGPTTFRGSPHRSAPVGAPGDGGGLRSRTLSVALDPSGGQGPHGWDALLTELAASASSGMQDTPGSEAAALSRQGTCHIPGVLPSFDLQQRRPSVFYTPVTEDSLVVTADAHRGIIVSGFLAPHSRPPGVVASREGAMTRSITIELVLESERHPQRLATQRSSLLSLAEHGGPGLCSADTAACVESSCGLERRGGEGEEDAAACDAAGAAAAETALPSETAAALDAAAAEGGVGGPRRLRSANASVFLEDESRWEDRVHFRVQGWTPQTERVGQEVLVFIHGFNCALDDAARTLGQLLALGNFPLHIRPIIFSWPSGRTWFYFASRHVGATSERTAADFGDMLEALAGEGCRRVHIIGHSMGARVLMAAVPELEKRAALLTQEGMEMGTATLLNPDMELLPFQLGLGRRLRALFPLVTVYSDSNDNALKGSELVNGLVSSWFRWQPSFEGQEMPFSRERQCCAMPWPGLDKSLGKHAHVRGELRDHDSNRLLDIDVVDTSFVEANVHELRHNYFHLNHELVADLRDLISSGRRAAFRSSRLQRVHDNTYSFLVAPSYVKNK